MTLKQLLQSFDELQTSSLVLGSLTKESVNEFVSILNRAIPSPYNPMEYAVYKFNRSKYLCDKPRFLNDIKNFYPYHSMILWADYEDILDAFNLKNKIFLGWDKSSNRYRGYVLNTMNKKDSFIVLEDDEIPILRKGQTVESVKAPSPEPKQEPKPDDIINGNDMDRVYDYMQSRLAKIMQQQTN